MFVCSESPGATGSAIYIYIYISLYLCIYIALPQPIMYNAALFWWKSSNASVPAEVSGTSMFHSLVTELKYLIHFLKCNITVALLKLP